MTPGTLIVTAFGQLSPSGRQSGPGAEQDLDRVFLARSELMGWSRNTTSASPPTPLLWEMNEAELTLGDGPAIGFVQVSLAFDSGLTEVADHPVLDEGPPPDVDLSNAEWAPYPMPDAGPPTDPAIAIPPLVQCMDDSLRRFGETRVTAYQLTATGLPSRQRSQQRDLERMLDWFNTRSPNPAPAVLTLATDRSDAHIASDVIKAVRQIHSSSFEFGPAPSPSVDDAAGDEGAWIQWTSADAGLAVSMPAWSADAIGWLLAMVLDAARSRQPTLEHLSVRLTRQSE